MVASSVLFCLRGRLTNLDRRRLLPLKEVGGNGTIISRWDFKVASAFERGHEIAGVLWGKRDGLTVRINFSREELSEKWVLANRLCEWQRDPCFVGGTGHTTEERDNIAAEGCEGRVGIARKSHDVFPECEWFTGALRNSVEEGGAAK